MKNTAIAFAILISVCIQSFAASPLQLPPIGVQLKWKVDTSRAQAAQFEAYRGETLDLTAEMKSYGEYITPGMYEPRLYWQTNGMGNSWWSAPAEWVIGQEDGMIRSYRATWYPTNDCGANVYNCFIGGPETTYRAAFRLRMLPSPGFTPNILPLPSVTYDAALFGEPTINGTNLTEWVTARSQAESDPVFSEWIRTNDFSSAGGSTGVDTNAVLGLIESATNALEAADTSHRIIREGMTDSYYYIKVDTAYSAETSDSAYKDSDGNIISDTYSTRGELDAVENSLSMVSNTVSAWQTYWDGDDVRVTVTNYYGSAGLPSLYLEQKMPTNELHSTPWFKTIWDERTRWNSFLEGYLTLTNTVANDLADRAWGVYDSSSGSYSPDGLLQLSQEQIMIASGMAYQKTVTAGGCSVWVLKSTSPTTISGVSSNGFFRIEDGDGNAIFEIVKGDKRVVGATATGVSMSGNTMTITYNSVSDEHPTLEVCTDLNAGDWKTEAETTVATVSWGGSSGAWVATVTPVVSRSSLFAKATFEAGGNTYIKNNVASSLDKVVVGGVEYTVTVETVNGKKLMVLQ